MAIFITLGGIALRLALAAVSIGGTAYGLKKMTDVGEANMFNKGVCTKCQGHFEYKTQVNGCRAYKCDFCNNAVLISHTSTDKDYKYTPSKLSKK